MKSKYIKLSIGILGLMLVYVLQRKLFYVLPFQIELGPQVYDREVIDTFPFIISKVIRFVLNDFFAILIINALFPERKYLTFAVWVFFIGFLLLLPLYLVLFLGYFNESFTYINHIHRLVMNPVLMMILIPAFYLQAKQGTGGSGD